MLLPEGAPSLGEEGALDGEGKDPKVAALCQHRTDTVRKWIAWANELTPKEEKLKRGLSEHRRSVLSNKRLLLLRRLLEESEHEDLGPGTFRRYVQRVLPRGQCPNRESSRRSRPAELSESDLRQSAKRSREAIIGTLGPSPDPVIDTIRQPTLLL